MRDLSFLACRYRMVKQSTVSACHEACVRKPEPSVARMIGKGKRVVSVVRQGYSKTKETYAGAERSSPRWSQRNKPNTALRTTRYKYIQVPRRKTNKPPRVSIADIYVCSQRKNKLQFSQGDPALTATDCQGGRKATAQKNGRVQTTMTLGSTETPHTQANLSLSPAVHSCS